MQGRAVTSEQTERLLDGLRHGMTRRAAAAFGGMHHATLYRMLASDATLATEVEKAESQAEAAFTKLVADAAANPKNWTAAAWWLERRHPDDFGRRDRIDVKIDLRALAEKAAPDIDPDAVLAEAERILQETR